MLIYIRTLSQYHFPRPLLSLVCENIANQKLESCRFHAMNKYTAYSRKRGSSELTDFALSELVENDISQHNSVYTSSFRHRNFVRVLMGVPVMRLFPGKAGIGPVKPTFSTEQRCQATKLPPRPLQPKNCRRISIVPSHPIHA